MFVIFFSRMAHVMDDEVFAGDENVNLSDSNLRKRHPWNSLVAESIDLLADVDELDDEEEEDGVGCPLPSTPEDNQLLEAEVSKCYLFFLFFVALIIAEGTHASECEIAYGCHIEKPLGNLRTMLILHSG